MKKTVWFGYALFALFFVAEAINLGSTVYTLLNSPYPIRPNAIWIFVGITLAGLLPIVLSYFIADSAYVKSKGRLVHHFNGVVSGLLALNLFQVLNFMAYTVIPMPNIPGIPQQVTQFWPSLVAVLIVCAVVAFYVHGRHRDSLLSYRPFQVVAVLTAAIIIGYLLYNMIWVMPPSTEWLWSYVANSSSLLIVIASFILVRDVLSSKPARLTFAVTAMTISTLTMLIVGQYLYRINSSTLLTIVPLVIGIAITAWYVLSCRRSALTK